jgi:hypothetical protein
MPHPVRSPSTDPSSTSTPSTKAVVVTRRYHAVVSITSGEVLAVAQTEAAARAAAATPWDDASQADADAYVAGLPCIQIDLTGPAEVLDAAASWFVDEVGLLVDDDLVPVAGVAVVPR